MITGSRRGELCALDWAGVDFDRAVLWVPFSIAQTKAGLKKKPTKTNKGRRVALDPHTLELLAEHRERCEERCSQLGCELARDAYLFSPAPDGTTPFVPRSITQRYRRMATKLKLRSTRLHSLRHYSATELIAAGMGSAGRPCSSLRTRPGRRLRSSSSGAAAAAATCPDMPDVPESWVATASMATGRSTPTTRTPVTPSVPNCACMTAP
jgi:integrase